jgi:hypothetical protein
MSAHGSRGCAMGDGFWFAIGAIVGTLGSIGTTWLTAYLGRQSQYPHYDAKIQAILREMLGGRLRWRDIETLARVTGLTDQDVKDYLIELDARGSANNGKLWGLISRNPVAEAGESDPKVEC